jgi:hypothetical protein
MSKEESGDLVLPTQESGYKDFDGTGEDRDILIKILQV